MWKFAHYEFSDFCSKYINNTFYTKFFDFSKFRAFVKITGEFFHKDSHNSKCNDLGDNYLSKVNNTDLILTTNINFS